MAVRIDKGYTGQIQMDMSHVFLYERWCDIPIDVEA